MQIPGYKIIDTLGEGGMARVYLAIQESFEREVALKVLDPHLSRDPSFGERFLHEARIVSRLVHPNIVTVYDVGVHRGNHFLSMEYVPGRDLKHRRFELSLLECIEVVKGVARALDYAGRKGCVHRDVKPDNIMLHAEDGRAVLMDFGIARIADQASTMTQTGTTVGTPHYMSPEHARGAAVDSRADLYSLGVVLFLLLTGHLPYDSDSAVSIGVMHISDSIPRLPEHLALFQPLIDRVLAKNPDDRFQTGNELVEALDGFDRETLESMERAGERSLVSEVDGDSPTLVQPQAVLTDTAHSSEGSVADSEVSGDFLAVHDDDRIDWNADSGPEPRGGRVWVLLVILMASAAGGALYWQESVRTQWDQWVAPLLPAQSPPQNREPAPVVQAPTGEAPASDAEPMPEEPAVAGNSSDAERDDALSQSPAMGVDDDPDSEADDPSNLPESDSLAHTFEPLDALPLSSREAPPREPESSEQSRDQRIDEISQTVAEQADQGDLEGALQRLERGMAEFSGSEKLALQRERLEVQLENQRRQQTEQQAQAEREARLQAQIDTIEALLDEGALERAGEQLRASRDEFPGSSALLSLDVEWNELRDAAQQPTIERARISAQPLDNLEEGQPGTLIPSRVLYTGFVYRNFGETSSVIQAILYDGSRQLQIALVPVVIQGEAGETYFRIERPVTGFSEGSYHLDLVSEGETLASVSFQLES